MDKKFDKDTEDVVFFAFRYALGRRTGAVTLLVSYLKNHWSRISINTQEQIKREIKQAIDYDNAGAECDVESWQEIIDLK